jgi:hypothetical protein
MVISLACTLTAGLTQIQDDQLPGQGAQGPALSPTRAEMPPGAPRKSPEAQKTPKPNICTVLAANLHLRADPGITAPVKGYLQAGDQIITSGKDHSGQWVEVITRAGMVGWVNSSYIKCEGEKGP